MLSVHGVTKLFGTFPANKDISFNIQPGEIHALLGENGAGKSTLVKMLYGSLQPTAGTIMWQGKPVSIQSPSEARELGIGMVFQHFSLFEALTVAENIALSMPSDSGINNIAKQAVEYSEKYGLKLNPNAVIGDLSVGERQRVEIIRCLLQEPQLLVLDEPTSVLTPQESEALFKTVEFLRDEGRAILFISHKLDEVRAHCDRATVLRFGEVVASCDPRTETAASIAGMMVGSDVDVVTKPVSSASTTDVFTIQNLSLPANGPFNVAMKDINLTVRSGEILGIAGIAGNGQSELFEAVSGERLASSANEITLRGHSVGKLGINQRRKLAAAFVPEERNGHGAIGALSLSENLLLSRHASDAVAYLKGGALKLVQSHLIAKATKRISEVMDVRKSGDDPKASSLSGGNLQKFIVGRELDRQPALLVINQPTWGVDAGAAQRIRQAIINLAEQGTGVLVISQDLDEIFEVSDRIAVIFEGRISNPKPVNEISRDEIGMLMAGLGLGDNGEGQSHAA